MEYKQKNRTLVAGFVLLLFVAYQFTFKKTFELNTSINKLSKDKELLSNAGERIKSLQMENRQLDAILQSNDISVDQSFEQTLLEKVVELEELHQLKLVSSGKPHIYESDEASMLSYVIEVKGDFRNLLLFASSLEQQRLGEFVSTSFEKKKNHSIGRNELKCKIIVQKLSK